MRSMAGAGVPADAFAARQWRRPNRNQQFRHDLARQWRSPPPWSKRMAMSTPFDGSAKRSSDQLKADVDLGKPVLETRQPGHEPMGRKCRGGGKGNGLHAWTARLLRPQQRLFDILETGGNSREKRAPFLGQESTGCSCGRNRETPRWASSRPIVRLTAGPVTQSSLAARANVPQRTAASKVTSELKEGSRWRSRGITKCNLPSQHLWNCGDPPAPVH